MERNLFARSFFLGIFTVLSLLISTNVIAQTQDVTPPSLVSFNFSPTTVDISLQDQLVTVTLAITDDLSGFSGGQVCLRSLSGDPVVYGAIERISGNELNGIYQSLITIPRFSKTGTWYFYYVRVYDFANNGYDYFTPELVEKGFPTEVTVTVTGAVDQTNNLITLVNSFNLPKGISNTLVSELSEVVRLLTAKKTIPACNVVNEFIADTLAQSGKKITTDEANRMITNAMGIKAAAGCP